MKTSDLAGAVGLSVQQVRNYKAFGFLPPAERGANGCRQYTPRHLDALETARRLINGYGWQHALAVMQAIHRDDLDAALALADARHAELDQARRHIDQTLAALRVATAQKVAWARVRDGEGMGIHAAAMRVGVRVSAALRRLRPPFFRRATRRCATHKRRASCSRSNTSTTATGTRCRAARACPATPRPSSARAASSSAR
jgi:DNA-binding transcriptional MerR regulator